jgi:hypothetical protein
MPHALHPSAKPGTTPHRAVFEDAAIFNGIPAFVFPPVFFQYAPAHWAQITRRAEI